MSEPIATKNSPKGVILTEIVITRIFNAPRERIWDAWTTPELMKLWWGPKTYTVPFSKIDLRVGGKYLFCMRSPEGQDVWITGVYREIITLERLVCTDSFADEHGNVVSASHYDMGDDFPLEALITVTLEEREKGKTILTLRHTGLPAGYMSENTELGWEESFDKLAECLKNKKE
jgi:uncharacterized protein YndB with AHSA1/START domain